MPIMLIHPETADVYMLHASDEKPRETFEDLVREGYNPIGPRAQAIADKLRAAQEQEKEQPVTIIQDLDVAENAFEILYDWISGGDRTGPAHWRRGGFSATHMESSPAGEFYHISGRAFVAYRYPDSAGFGYRGRIDLRHATLEQLLQLAEEVTSRYAALAPEKQPVLAVPGTKAET